MAHGVSIIHAMMLLTTNITAYAILVAMEDRNLDMPQGPHSIEHDAAPQHEAPTDHRVAAEGSNRAGIARTAPMLTVEEGSLRRSRVRRYVVVRQMKSMPRTATSASPTLFPLLRCITGC
jgi:hypothetical protein